MDQHRNHHHHHHEPSEELYHLDKMAEVHASNPKILKVNEQVVALLPLKNLPNKSRILDIGCGAGRIALLLGKRPDVASVVGVDISEGMIHTAKQLLQASSSDIQAKVSFQVASRLPTKELEPWKGSKDMVVMSLVLGHIAPKAAGQSVLATAVSTLKPGGQFALAEFLFVEEDDEAVNHHTADSTHHHAHDGDHSHHHHSHNGGPSGDHESHHYGGHTAFTELEIRTIFATCGLDPADQFTPFEFEWGGVTRKCIMAVGTKQ